MARTVRRGGVLVELSPADDAAWDAAEAVDQANQAAYEQSLADGTYAETTAIAGFDGDLEKPITYKDLKAFAQAIKDQFPTFDLIQFRSDFIARRKALK